MISLSALTFLRLIQFYSDTHVRLTGHNASFAGRVEVFSHGVWGRVTDYGNWRKKEASVVCRQLGFPGVITAVRYSAFGEGSGPVVMSSVQCVGTEDTLQQCQYQDWMKSFLYPGYEVGVICKTHEFYPDHSDISVRLQGSTIPNAGRVEVLYAGVWGTISSNNWDMNDAMVVCRQLGYQAGAEAALQNGVYGLVSGPVWLTNLQCTGSESNVMSCVYDELGNKTELQHRTYSASLICKDTSFPSGMTVRLRGSHSSNMGQVEVHYAGRWGSIYDSGWDIEDATVACRQLGYSTASLSGYRLFCSDDVPHWFTNFRCNGNETSLDQCVWDFPTFYSSRYRYCANIACTDRMVVAGPELRLRGSPVPHAGRVELRFKGIWGTMYTDDDPFLFHGGYRREIIRVICRQLGFVDGLVPIGRSVFGPGEGPQWFRNYHLQCLGSETNIMNCSHSQPQFTILGHDTDLSVVCKPNVSQTNNFQVRLTGSSLPFVGTIEVLYYGVWGGILGIGNIDIRVGHVVCRQLGYSGAEQIFQRAAFGRVKGPLWIYNIQCNGNETQISHCTVTTWDKVWYSWHHHFQNPDYASGVLCKGANVSSSKVENVRLAGAPIDNAGRVEVFHAGVWGIIYRWNWDINDAHVVCRQLGYPGAISYGYNNQFGIGSGPVWFENVRCLGNESRFEECSKSVLGYPCCSFSNAATALCKLQSQSVTSQNCSRTKCFSNGTCIDTAVGAICNCTDGFTGPHCEIRIIDQCKYFPCQNGGQCFSNGSSYICSCPNGLTGQHCKENIFVASNPCQSDPCPNSTSCYHNNTHYNCVSNAKGNSSNVQYMPMKEKAVSDTYLIVGLSVASLLVVVLAAVIGYLIFKNRQRTNDRPNNPRAVFSNRAYKADSENKLDDAPTDDVDLGMVATQSRDVLSAKPAIYENPSRPLPPIPPPHNTRTEVTRPTARQTNGNCNNVTATKQAEKHYMGLSERNGNSARPHVTEPSSYMSLSPERPEAASYSSPNSARPKPPVKKQRGNNGKRRQESHEMYENTQR